MNNNQKIVLALLYFQNLKIIHDGIKQENIMITINYQVKLIDF
jgi:serine/threonine protein kinase